jgi:hypothetical protein
LGRSVWVASGSLKIIFCHRPDLSMKTRAWLFIFLSAAAGLRAEIEFRGYINSADGVSMFSLIDTQDDTSRWLRQGEIFNGYKVASFDPKTMVLSLERDGKPLTVKFKDARISEALSEKGKAVQVKVAVGADGAISLDGISQTDDAFRSTLRSMAERESL